MRESEISQPAGRLPFEGGNISRFRERRNNRITRPRASDRGGGVYIKTDRISSEATVGVGLNSKNGAYKRQQDQESLSSGEN